MKTINIQNHRQISDAMQRMANAIRTRNIGKDMSDADKAAARHLEEMSLGHYRKAVILPAHNLFRWGE